MATPHEQTSEQSTENDLYVLLNVSRKATLSEIRLAYRKLSQLYHPDKHTDPKAKVVAKNVFTDIKEAYEILSDEKLRRIYDEFGLKNARDASSPHHELTPYSELLNRFRAEASANDSGPGGNNPNTPRDAYFTIVNMAEAHVDGTGLSVALEDGVFNSDAPLGVITQVSLSSIATAYISQDVSLNAQYYTTSQRRSASPSGIGELELSARYHFSPHMQFELSAQKSLEEWGSVVYAAEAVRVLDRFSQMSIKTAFDPSRADASTLLTVSRKFDERRSASVVWSTGMLAYFAFQWTREGYDEFVRYKSNQKKSAEDSDDDDDDDDDENTFEETEMRSEPSRRQQLKTRLGQRLHNFLEPCGCRYTLRFSGVPLLRASFRRPIGSLYPLFEPCEALGTNDGASVKVATQIGIGGWQVEVGGGERYVMSDTEWAMMIECGSLGVTWKLRLERSGHRFVLPVVLVSANSDAKSATVAAMLSSLFVATVQSLIVRPFVKYKLAEEKAEARARRAEELKKSQEEAEASVALLKRQVETSREKEEAVEIDGRSKAGLLIERAVYGIREAVTAVRLRDASFAGRELISEVIEVTNSVQALVEDSTVQVVSSTKSTLMGFWDPSAVGIKEELALKCLLCTETIGTSKAVYTTPCHHVFCLECSAEKFRDELVCPLCDTVLPKDGTQKINLRPSKDDIQRASHDAIRKAGVEPQQLCAVLESGLEFWATQQRNEALMYKESLQNVKEELERVKKLNRKLSISLEGEKRKAQSVLDEKEQLIEQLEDLEKRFEEKARAHRKLNDSYKTLVKSIQDATQANIQNSQLQSILNRNEQSQHPNIAQIDDDTRQRTRENTSPEREAGELENSDYSQPILFSSRNSNSNEHDNPLVRRSLFEVQKDKKNKSTRKTNRRDRRAHHRVDESRRGEHSEPRERRDRYI